MFPSWGQLTVLLGPIFALAAFFVSNKEANQSAALISALIWYIVGDLFSRLAILVDNARKRDIYRDSIKKIVEEGFKRAAGQRKKFFHDTELLVRGQAVTIFVGKGQAAKEYFERRISEISSVRNTYVNMTNRKVEHGSTEDKFIAAGYEAALRDASVSWVDVIAGPSDRYFSRFEGVDPDQTRARFQCHILKNPIPTVNFLIMEYKSGRSAEVLFGWGLYDRKSDGDVFSSTDKRMVDYFIELHDAMIADANPVEFSDLVKGSISS